MISTEEQQSIFMHVENSRKIILSTNIAESSITVPDVEYGKIFYFIFLFVRTIKSIELIVCLFRSVSYRLLFDKIFEKWFAEKLYTFGNDMGIEK